MLVNFIVQFISSHFMSSVVLGPHLNVTCCIVINKKFMSSLNIDIGLCGSVQMSI